jgi:hypothetical protein
MKSYKDLEIYKIAFELAVKVYRLSLQLPNPDKYETGGQIRRSTRQPDASTLLSTGNPTTGQHDNLFKTSQTHIPCSAVHQ